MSKRSRQRKIDLFLDNLLYIETFYCNIFIILNEEITVKLKKIDDITRIKQLQLQKMEEEVEKVRIEKERANYEFERLKAKNNKPWYKRENFLRIGTQISLVSGILTFFITYVLLPTFQKDTIKNQLNVEIQRKENLKLKNELIKRENIIDSFSSTLNKQSAILNSREKKIFSEMTKYDSLRKFTFKEISLLSRENKLLKKQLAKKNPILEKRISSLKDSLKIVKSEKTKLLNELNNDSIIIQKGDLKFTLRDFYQIEIIVWNHFEEFSTLINQRLKLNNYSKTGVVIEKLDKMFERDATIETINSNNGKKRYSVKEYLSMFIDKYFQQYGGSILLEFKIEEIPKSSIKIINTNTYTVDVIYAQILKVNDYENSVNYTDYTKKKVTLTIRAINNLNGENRYQSKFNSIKFVE